MKILTKIIFIIFLSIFIFSCNKKQETKIITRHIKVKDSTKEKSDSIPNKFDCYDGSQTEMNVCSANELIYYDSILNVRYKYLIKKIDTEIKDDYENYNLRLKTSIINSQKNWIISKEKNREVFDIEYEGGSILPLAKNTQTIRDTKERIIFLEYFIHED
ncbi:MULTISPECIES: lysozyme inhibitor LprI family protein [Flavobacterium]|uniref:DUF1311 domain-containing protein n=1 Tax=Flavobacterium gawalongense TaxID=2594432 RepID=A0A553BC20_9FLAO|nr:lysozyme inhibitor LprI family protein [Flavobacterium gawalongense]TRW98089.1 DUF1311 domain-containing protein [Flavobacterium gawalongense]TRX02692.1 DUF1311 domain-containing protein [Flavobacterium gawalongense]TRX05789.1 DUF1311 domain-containing protein [Flavobacterium gawalongense]TRX06696.1 DUF1311 domain-containing protein [Flavobacterium gawalongense]TRX22420.1 DUF1311 domain-containing protein [Flavobacterium gawalongense]